MSRTPMTSIGAALLRQELERLKTVERGRIIQAIAEARAHGDLKENAEYHAAKEQQGFVEGRIIEIENKLGQAQVIDISLLKSSGRVVFGATVGLINLKDNGTVSYQIVGEDEADLAQRKISYRSPIASALIGKMEGDEVAVNTPGGVVEYEITMVTFENAGVSAG